MINVNFFRTLNIKDLQKFQEGFTQENWLNLSKNSKFCGHSRYENPPPSRNSLNPHHMNTNRHLMAQQLILFIYSDHALPRSCLLMSALKPPYDILESSFLCAPVPWFCKSVLRTSPLGDITETLSRHLSQWTQLCRIQGPPCWPLTGFWTSPPWVFSSCLLLLFFPSCITKWNKNPEI